MGENPRIRPWPKIVEALPVLSTQEKKALKHSIKAHGGVKVPIMILPDGRIIDGHHRWELAIGDVPYEVFNGSEDDAYDLGIALNLHRRQLSPEQINEVRKRLAADKEKQKQAAMAMRRSGKTQAQVAAELGVDQATISRWEDGKDISDMQAHIPNTPDLRLKITTQQKDEIAERIESGETQQAIADDLKITQGRVAQIAARQKKKQEEEKERNKAAAEARKLKIPEFVYGDFREVAKQIKPNSVDLIFTDPPYDRKSLPLYGDLAAIAQEKLTKGGSLITYLGQYQIDGVLNMVTPHLRLWWTLAVIHTGTSARMREYGVVVKWKPLLWFVKETRSDKETFVDDAVLSEQEKSTHNWQQSLVEAKYYIEKLVHKGGFVWDPFCGGGTTAIACRSLRIRFITCDTDKQALNRAKARYKDVAS